MLIGHARTSTSSQDHALQMDALENAGCERIFIDTASGMKADRPELARALEFARHDDRSWFGGSAGWRAAFANSSTRWRIFRGGESG